MNDFFNSPCGDCGVETHPKHTDDGEYYMVENAVWRSIIYPESDYTYCMYLCIGCLESRLSRRLTSMDFSLVPMNFTSDEVYNRSARLIDRMGVRFKDEKSFEEMEKRERKKFGL